MSSMFHVSHITSWRPDDYASMTFPSLVDYPDLVLPRNLDLNTQIRPLPILKILEARGSVCMTNCEGLERRRNQNCHGRMVE